MLVFGHYQHLPRFTVLSSVVFIDLIIICMLHFNSNHWNMWSRICFVFIGFDWLTENAGHEIDRPSKSWEWKCKSSKWRTWLQDVKMQDMKLQDIVGIFTRIYSSFILGITTKKCTESNSTMHMQSMTTILNHVGLINICCQSLTYTELNSQDLIALIVNTQMAHCIWWLFLCCFICIYTRSTPAFTNLAFSCPAFSEPAVWSVIMSCIFTSCNLVLHLHVLHSYLLHFQHPHFEKLILAVLMLCLI